MPGDEYERTLMERTALDEPVGIEPAEEWTADDLDRDEILRTLNAAIGKGRQEDPGSRDIMEVLRGFGLVRDGRLLRAAVVLFGREDRLLPGYTQCRLRVARFRGTDKSEATDERQFHGHAFRLLGLGGQLPPRDAAGRPAESSRTSTSVRTTRSIRRPPCGKPSPTRSATGSTDTGGGSVSVEPFTTIGWRSRLRADCTSG